MEPHPATILHAHVATVSTFGYVGYLGVCRLFATAAVGNREVCRRGCRREVLWGSALSDKGTGALTERLPLEVIEVQLKAGGGASMWYRHWWQQAVF